MDLRKLTEAVMMMASVKFDVTKKFDRDAFQHVTYVANRSLFILKNEGISWESSTKIGKYLWRLVRVMQAYNEKNKELTMESVIDVVMEFRSVFDGG